MGVRLKTIGQLSNGWFLLFVGLYLFHHWMVVQGYSIPFLKSYFGDLLSIPIFLHLVTVTLCIVLKQPDFKADWFMLLSLWLLVSIVFEGILPCYYERYTKDYWDILAYGLGLVLALFTVYK
jgi:hypothetical protein